MSLKTKQTLLQNQLNHQGFTLIEVLIAASLSIVVIYAIMTMMIEAQNSVNKSGAEMGVKTEFDIQISDFSKYISNSVRLHPAENYIASDNQYRGILAMKKAYPTMCKYSADLIAKTEDYSILRMTSLRKNFSPKRLLRPWAESSAGQTGVNHELRFSYVTGEDEFLVTPAPKEIVLFDVDGLITRRFKVKSGSIQKVVDSAADPYDDQAKYNTDGTAKKFTYLKMLLEMPKNAEGGLQNPNNQNLFLVNSMIYISDTEFLCADTSMKKIIKVSEHDLENPKVFLDISNEKFQFDRFQLRFYTTKDIAQRVEPNDFKYFRFYWDEKPNEVELGCFNAINLNIMMRVPRRSGFVDTNLSRTQFLGNFDRSRPASCLTP